MELLEISNLLLLLSIFVMLFFVMAFSQESSSPPATERTQWFRDAKFGLFIHWGAYAQLGYHEWVRQLCHIPLSEYQYYVDHFNPVDFKPDEWVDLAREAGVKYMVITSKHHDGFCIFDSRWTDYDIMQSQYGRDALQMLTDACARKGMPLGFYYSIMDWHHPDYLPRRPWETDRPEAGADLNRYIDYMKNQLQELIEKYDPTMIWFDGEWEHTVEEMRSAEVEKMLLSLKPKLLINDRLFRRAPGHGDFGTPENYVPATGVENTDGAPALWEACYTMNYNSWGYNHYEIEFHTQTQLIRQLIEIVSKGGNLLLNVGPTPEGTLQPEFVARLKALGKWLKVNGEAIYGTTASCFNKLPFFGRCTVKEHRIYVHVMGWPTNRQIELPGLQTPVTEVALLAQPDQHLRFQQTKNSVMIELPERAPDRDATVIVVHLKSSPRVIPYEIKPQADQSLQLPIYLADIQSQMGQRAFLEQYYRVTLLTNWQNVNDFPVWEFTTERPAKYEVQISYACGWGEKGSQFVVKVDNYEIPGVAETSGSEFFPATFALGTVMLPPGKHRLECRIKSVVNNSALRLEKINLVPLSH